MPRCLDCGKFMNGVCTAAAIAKVELEREINPAAACIIPIVESYMAQIRPGMAVLEVGCGSWRRIREHCERIGARYEGIDAESEYFGKPSAATRIENLAELSFPDGSFDLVIGSQTMEHWAEHGCALDWGLYQCFRVCKPGGKILLNVPIHFHGTRDFLLGDLDRIRRRFEGFSSGARLESWRYPSEPIQPYFAHRGFWRLRHKPTYILDIQATRDERRLSRPSRLLNLRGQAAKLAYYPLSFNLHRVMRKLRGAPKKLFFLALEAFQINRVFRLLNRGRIKTLLFHHVTAPDELRKQLRYLKRNFNLVGIGSDGEWRNLRSDRVNVLLTFDDGFADNYEKGFPVLREEEAPGCFFLISDLLPTGAMPDFARKHVASGTPESTFATMTPSQVRQMQEQGMTFGSHSRTHRDFSGLSEEEALEDASQSRQSLERALSTPVGTFAFPWGRHRKEQLQALLLEFRRVFLVEHGFSSAEDRVIRRNEVADTLQMYAASSGALDFFRKLFRGFSDAERDQPTS